VKKAAGLTAVCAGVVVTFPLLILIELIGRYDRFSYRPLRRRRPRASVKRAAASGRAPAQHEAPPWNGPAGLPLPLDMEFAQGTGSEGTGSVDASNWRCDYCSGLSSLWRLDLAFRGCEPLFLREWFGVW